MFNTYLPIILILMADIGAISMITGTPPKKGEVYGKHDTKPGDFIYGPYTALAVPNILNLGMEGKWDDRFGAGLNYGFLPSRTFGSSQLSTNAYDVRLRWFPVRNSFFIGMALGKRSLLVKRSQEISGIPLDAEMNVSTVYLAPHIGWHWVFNSGTFMGFDFGWQYALSAETELSTNLDNTDAVQTSEFKTIKGQITDLGNQYGKIGLPFVTVFQIGFLF